nr:dTDP-4-dehydrorhamnose 3,5-epimerase [Gemmatimonadaceae bacterium]
MKIQETGLPGVRLITPQEWRDERGSFSESWQRRRFEEAGLPAEWVQDNVSRSTAGVLRGLHFQQPGGQSKLVRVMQGAIFDVVVDVRYDSPSFGRAASFVLTDEGGIQLFVPAGYAHGFLVTSPEAVVHYKCTEYYQPQHERTLLWNDPAIGIVWPAAAPVVSAKDAVGRPLAAFSTHELP